MQPALRPREEAKRKSLPTLRTLVLNADYRPLSTYPLSIIAAQDAVSAMWRERADVVETWPDAFFRSQSVAIAVPKIMALRQYAPISGAPNSAGGRSCCGTGSAVSIAEPRTRRPI